nr:transcription initiation factor TFIID subunit 9-like [Coffea arabica]
MAVEDYGGVIHQFLQVCYNRYVVYVLRNGQIYSDHAGKSVIDSDDVKLAIQCQFQLLAPSSRSSGPTRISYEHKQPELYQNQLPGLEFHSLLNRTTLISPNYQFAIARKETKPSKQLKKQMERLLILFPTTEDRCFASHSSACNLFQLDLNDQDELFSLAGIAGACRAYSPVLGCVHIFLTAKFPGMSTFVIPLFLSLTAFTEAGSWGRDSS